jgi:hypothetical protein
MWNARCWSWINFMRHCKKIEYLATIASATQANKCPLKPNTKQAPARTSKAQLNKQARTSKAQLRPPSPSSFLHLHHPSSLSILVPPLNLHAPPPVFARVRQRSCRQLLPVSEELLRHGAGGWERTRTVCGEEQKGRRGRTLKFLRRPATHHGAASLLLAHGSP